VFALWGVQYSYCSAKTSSYLIKKGMPYRGLYPSYPKLQARILPKVQPMRICPWGTRLFFPFQFQAL